MLCKIWMSGLVVVALALGQEPPDGVIGVSVPSGKSYNGKAFEYEKKFRERNHRHMIYDIRYPSPVVSPHEANNTVPAELYVPIGIKAGQRLPAVVCLHIIHDNFDLERLLCTRLAQRGVIALFFKQPYYSERGGKVGKSMAISSPEVFVEGLDQGLEDARRAVDILNAMETVDPEHIGITGISMGAVQAASVCGREPRVSKAFLTLGGCDIRHVIMTAHETRRIRAFIQGLSEESRARVWEIIERNDPIMAKDALRKLAQKGGLRMVCAAEDEVIPPECGRKLAEAAGFADGVTWLEGMGHYSAMAGFPSIMTDIVSFFGADVPAAWQPPANNGEKSAFELLGGFLSGLSSFMGGEPRADTAHMVGVRADVKAGGKRYKGAFDLVRGGEGRFKLTGDFPEIGKAGLGAGDYPWLTGAGQKVFCGTLEPVASGAFAQMVLPERLMRFKVGVGALAGVALSPEALKEYYSMEDNRAADGQCDLTMKVAHKHVKGTLRWSFAKDGTPKQVEWVFKESEGKAVFTHWRLNAVTDDSVFREPAGLTRHEVRQEDVWRMFASVFEFAVEATE